MASTSAFIFRSSGVVALSLASERRRARVMISTPLILVLSRFWRAKRPGKSRRSTSVSAYLILMRRLLTSRFDSDRKECVDKESSKGTAKRHDDVVMPRETLSRYIG